MNNSKKTIMWVDDEIDLLKPQLLFLESKGYEVIGLTNGRDAIDYLETNKAIDIVLLDESMAGLSGLETLDILKTKRPQLPMVMVTKNEEEDLMEDAIGAQISDYLIKPVKSQQLLSSIKKLTEDKTLIRERTTTNYQQAFQKMFTKIQELEDCKGWIDFYKELVWWELELDKSASVDVHEIFQMQKREANRAFTKFIERNYVRLLNDDNEVIFSHQVLEKWFLPTCHKAKHTLLLVIDNLRYDQWKVLQKFLTDQYTIQDEALYFSILPTATQYARNALFSGLLPNDIIKHYPSLWIDEQAQGSKNKYEEQHFKSFIERKSTRIDKVDFFKVANYEMGKSLEARALNVLNHDVTAIVYNFVDMLSHAKTDMEVIKELASDDRSYRSLTESWFKNSPLRQALIALAQKDVEVILTTDHGTKRVKTASKCSGEQSITSNTRYKSGRKLTYQSKDVFRVKDPSSIGLPSPSLGAEYIFAKDENFFVYPNNFAHFANHFSDSFQHGGVSLEEMIVPWIHLKPKG